MSFVPVTFKRENPFRDRGSDKRYVADESPLPRSVGRALVPVLSKDDQVLPVVPRYARESVTFHDREEQTNQRLEREARHVKAVGAARRGKKTRDTSAATREDERFMERFNNPPGSQVPNPPPRREVGGGPRRGESSLDMLRRP
jgi:hypothetical protein